MCVAFLDSACGARSHGFLSTRQQILSCDLNKQSQCFGDSLVIDCLIDLIHCGVTQLE